MFDVHTHALPFVDDGSKSVEESVKMLNSAEMEGVTDMVLTPHYIEGEYETSIEKIKEVFEQFKAIVKEQGINVNLYLGQEIYIRKGYKKLFDENKFLSVNNTKLVLVEFSTRTDFDIAEAVYDLKRMGYTPIVAHFERYQYADISVAEEIKELGGYIQVNADSIVGKGKNAYYKKIKTMIKEGFVDFVASDVHAFRESNLSKAYDYIAKKFGLSTANKLFTENAKKIITG